MRNQQLQAKGKALPPPPPQGHKYAKRHDGSLVVVPIPYYDNGGDLPSLYVGKGKGDMISKVYYDTLRFRRGGLIDASNYTMFQVPNGQSSEIANGNGAASDSYKKSLADTNFKTAGQLAISDMFIIESIQFQVLACSVDGVDATGNAVTFDESENPASDTVHSSTWLLHQVQNGFYVSFEFGSNRKSYEDGLVGHFPSDYGTSGFAGGTIIAPNAVSNITALEVVAQNGFGRAQKLATPRYIKGAENIGCSVLPQYKFISNMDFQLRCSLKGYLISPA